MTNVIDFPKMFKGSTPQGIAEALLDYVKDKPDAKMIVIIKDDYEDNEGELTMGWTPMDAAEMILMIRYAEYKWLRRTFKDEDAYYVDTE